MTKSEFRAYHLASYQKYPEACELCKRGDPLYRVKLDSTGKVVLIHESDLEHANEPR